MQFPNKNPMNLLVSNGVNNQNQKQTFNAPPAKFACFTKDKVSLSALVSILPNYTKTAQIFIGRKG